MNDEGCTMNGRDQNAGKPAPLQFGIRAVLVMAVAMAALFGLLRWLEVPPQASYIVLAILVASVIAAVALLLAIAGSVTGDDDERR
jgi:hypothetical protein